MMYKYKFPQFQTFDPYDWFCGPGSHIMNYIWMFFEKIYLNKTKKKDHHVIDSRIYFHLKCTIQSNSIILNSIIVDIQKTVSLLKKD